MSECEARAIGFEIDHYYPKAHGGGNEYDNLMYSCEQCNRYKGDYWPVRVGQEMIVRVDRESPESHWVLSGEGENLLAGLTSKGKCTIEVLELNRKALRRLREIREKLRLDRIVIANGLRALSGARLDLFPEPLRVRIVSLTRELHDNWEETERIVQEEIRRDLKSELLEKDPGKGAHTARRRGYLRKQNVVLPGE